MSGTQIIPAELYARLKAEADRRGRENLENGELLTTRQLATILQISESTVRRLAREGLIPYFRITPGHLVRFNLKVVLYALSDAPPPFQLIRRYTPDTGWQHYEMKGVLDLIRRFEAIRRIDVLRERLSSSYGEMPDSVESVREDRLR